MGRSRSGIAMLVGVLALSTACTGDDPAPRAAHGAACANLTSDDGPLDTVERGWSALPDSSPIRTSALPRRLASAATITATSTSLLQDPPGRVRMIAFWGEPGEAEPMNDTPVTFLGTDGRWRTLTARELGGGRGTFLPAGQDPGPYALAPDGSRWIVASRGWNQMMDFATAGLVKLIPGRFAQFATWAPDSAAVALWNIARPGVDVFDRSGQRLGHLPVTPEKRSVLMPDAETVAVVDLASVGGRPSVRIATYGLDGSERAALTCAVPRGYPAKATAVTGYDGQQLRVSALVDAQHSRYRTSVIDLATGEVTMDVEYRSPDVYFGQWLRPGLLVAGLGGAADIDAIDPATGDRASITRVTPYADQVGYSNHASSQYAADLVFGG